MEKNKRHAILTLVMMIIIGVTYAQKKVVPVTQSSFTGITLPGGSKRDRRGLNESLVKSLLEIESKKVNAEIKSVEVLTITMGLNADSLANQFAMQGWTIEPVEGDNKYAWLRKDQRCVLAFFSISKKVTNLYFGETNYVNTNNNQVNTNTTKDIKDTITTTTTTTIQTNSPSVPYKSNYTFYRTNFDDGWVSLEKENWVEVTKGDMRVYLLYALPYNASDFSGTGVVDRDYYWDNYVTKYFSVQVKQYRDNGEVMSSQKPNYVEGWAKDKQTGEKRFIAMRLSIVPNTAYLIIASAKDESSLFQQFPKANGKYISDLANMSGYNKFAVSVNDILGTWQDGKTSTMQWYYSAPGGYEGYAGMTAAATSATFNFLEGGKYTSIHNGATGVVGSMNTFQQNYKGTYTVSEWIINATNRWEGQTEKFDASFMVVKGGRVLSLKGKGISYSLVKVK